MVTGSEILRSAAAIITTYGWAQGANARTTEGAVCRITAPDAAYFSLYGAVMKAMVLAGAIDGRGDDKAVQNTMPMWEVLTRQATRERIGYAGVHPVFQFNDEAGQTQANVTGFLTDCAGMLEAIEKTANQPKPPSGGQK